MPPKKNWLVIHNGDDQGGQIISRATKALSVSKFGLKPTQGEELVLHEMPLAGRNAPRRLPGDIGLSPAIRGTTELRLHLEGQNQQIDGIIYSGHGIRLGNQEAALLDMNKYRESYGNTHPEKNNALRNVARAKLVAIDMVEFSELLSAARAEHVVMASCYGLRVVNHLDRVLAENQILDRLAGTRFEGTSGPLTGASIEHSLRSVLSHPNNPQIYAFSRKENYKLSLQSRQKNRKALQAFLKAEDGLTVKTTTVKVPPKRAVSLAPIKPKGTAAHLPIQPIGKVGGQPASGTQTLPQIGKKQFTSTSGLSQIRKI